MCSQHLHCLPAFLQAETNRRRKLPLQHAWGRPPQLWVLLVTQKHKSVFSWLLSAARTCRKGRKASISSILTLSDPCVITSLQYPSIHAQGIPLEIGFWSLTTVSVYCFNYIKTNWHLYAANKKACCRGLKGSYSRLTISLRLPSTALVSSTAKLHY